MTPEESEVESKRLTFAVQRAISYAIVGVFSFLILQMTAKIIWFGPPTDTVELLKQGWNLLQNLMMGVAGYWIGAAKSSQTKDDQQAKITEKMTDKVIANGAIAPARTPIAEVVSWWTRLENDETTKIIAAGKTDSEVKSFIDAAKDSMATPGQLASLVAKGLLTQERATIIGASKGNSGDAEAAMRAAIAAAALAAPAAAAVAAPASAAIAAPPAAAVAAPPVVNEVVPPVVEAEVAKALAAREALEKAEKPK